MGAGSGRVVVVGGGPAGAIAARALAVKGRDVLLFDAGLGAPDRIEMLPPAALATFVGAGLGHLLDEPSIAIACLGIVRGEDREEFIRRPGGRGVAVHRPSLDAALKALAITAGVEVRSERLKTARHEDDSITLIVGGPRGSKRLSAETVIDATGRAAAVSRRLGAKITTLQRLTAHQQVAGPPIGPWLSFSVSVAGWSYAITGPGGRVDSWRITAIPAPVASHDTVDASTRLLEPAAGPRWIAIGDASAAFDPICCQGLSHAATTAIVAAGLILRDATVRPHAAQSYAAACRETVLATEDGRRALYAGMPAHSGLATRLVR